MSADDVLDNTREIAEQIFRKPPGPPDSIQLYLEEQTSDMASRSNASQFINEILTVITMHGVEILFGHRDLRKITREEANKIYSYVASYGYKVVFDGSGPQFVKI